MLFLHGTTSSALESRHHVKLVSLHRIKADLLGWSEGWSVKSIAQALRLSETASRHLNDYLKKEKFENGGSESRLSHFLSIL